MQTAPSCNRLLPPDLILHNIVVLIFRGRKFILSHLQIKDIEEYWKQLLKKYGKLMKWKPMKNANLIEIKSKQRDEL